jgi:hypothetical protein
MCAGRGSGHDLIPLFLRVDQVDFRQPIVFQNTTVGRLACATVGCVAMLSPHGVLMRLCRQVERVATRSVATQVARLSISEHTACANKFQFDGPLAGETGTNRQQHSSPIGLLGNPARQHDKPEVLWSALVTDINLLP